VSSSLVSKAEARLIDLFSVFGLLFPVLHSSPVTEEMENRTRRNPKRETGK